MSNKTKLSNLTIKNENSPNSSRYNDVSVELSSRSASYRLIFKSSNNDIIAEYTLSDCSYIEESSIPGTIVSISSKSRKQTIILHDKTGTCPDLLKDLRNILTQQESNDAPAASSSEETQLLIEAVKNQNAKEAARIAERLARSRSNIQFAMDFINETGDNSSHELPTPVLKPLKFELRIESYLIENQDDNLYNITVIQGTSIRDLKQLIDRETGISVDQQYWFNGRDCLSDDHQLSHAPLVLYIAKPQ